jgi:hypothetical protein
VDSKAKNGIRGADPKTVGETLGLGADPRTVGETLGLGADPRTAGAVPKTSNIV